MLFAVALTALALTGTAASVPVSGGTAAQRAIVSRVLAEADPGVISSARIDARHYLVLAGPAGACNGTSPPARGSLCRRVLADRWALLVPNAGNACPGSPLGAWNVSINGTLAGYAVSRSYNGCFGGTVQRWARLLGV
jgi:hypothetical protein